MSAIDGLLRCVFEQDIGTLEVVRLSGREEKSCRIVQCIDRISAQAATATSDGLFARILLFAPALCWWARTMVASIMADSLSASYAKVWNTSCHTLL
ncbi:MAG: hypothetical protein K2Y10_08380 [Burkholderiaceae bacterium]|nr:hypothetical protein [Burkholderiaceae bacterium]